MNAYFDLPNLRSYAKAAGHQNFKSCTNMLRQNFNIHFTFDKKTLEKEKKQLKQGIMNLLKMMTSNRGNSESFVWNDKSLPRLIGGDVYSKLTKEQLTSLYFLDDPSVNEMADQGCLLFASEGNEIKVLSNLLIENNLQPTKKYDIRKMHDWNVLEINASPCTDIIIVDQYFFSQSDVYFDYNAFKIIETLSKINSHHVNVVIFTTAKDNPFKTIGDKLKNRIGEKLSLTFVTIDGKTKEHDRTIITNYKIFESGDSFTYFNDKGENISRGKWLHVNSHGDREIRQQTLDYIEELQHLVNIKKSGLNSIIGDKKSNFLKF